MKWDSNIEMEWFGPIILLFIVVMGNAYRFGAIGVAIGFTLFITILFGLSFGCWIIGVIRSLNRAKRVKKAQKAQKAQNFNKFNKENQTSDEEHLQILKSLVYCGDEEAVLELAAIVSKKPKKPKKYKKYKKKKIIKLNPEYESKSKKTITVTHSDNPPMPSGNKKKVVVKMGDKTVYNSESDPEYNDVEYPDSSKPVEPTNDNNDTNDTNDTTGINNDKENKLAAIVESEIGIKPDETPETPETPTNLEKVAMKHSLAVMKAVLSKTNAIK